jgi:flagellar biosynthesis/type III secretory pathway protein FliH
MRLSVRVPHEFEDQEDAWMDGYDQGFVEGEEEAYNEGHDDGYIAGCKETTKKLDKSLFDNLGEKIDVFFEEVEKLHNSSLYFKHLIQKQIHDRHLSSKE